MIRAFNIKFPLNQSETVTQSSVEQVERSEPDPDPLPLIIIPDGERMLDIEIELDDDSSLWDRIDNIQLSCQQMEEDFDQMNEEEELELGEVEKSLQDSFFDVGRSNHDFIHSQHVLLSTPLRAHCIAHLLQLVIKDGLKAISVRILFVSLIRKLRANSEIFLECCCRCHG